MKIRLYCAADLEELHRINEDNVPAVGPLSCEALDVLISGSHVTFVAEDAGQIGGFLLGLVEGVDYGSLNYAWFCKRYPSFAYVDRIAVDAGFQGSGIGALLYEALENHVAGSRPVLTCEVNSLPPNPGSLRFHKRLGFVEAGEQVFEPGKKAVVYLAKSLIQAS
ncbi:MAG: GNAT family N-acetyltransferase [Alphaproteobacteria bacterium]|jgi:uncharacterized protein|nr:GNAT family N-acetyltransferase [Alphaproteobacteria bacterium]MBT4082635.1 GNAT family N-acetyltransferase [Alphaproteobacteria bacterium]MBT4545897.1 GNAT family N-acetyltransferase [Alphaproteobacteria bacterium]MBT7746402.1 GNAT family N-acetyltransferase [Alphaproteobacteria bacterium]